MDSSVAHAAELAKTDRSLVVLVRDGNEQAAKALYERYARRVLGLVESKIGERLKTTTEPEDVVQSVFRSIFRGVQSGHYSAPPGSTLWSLLAVIAVRKVHRQADHHFAQRRDSRVTVSLESMIESFSAREASLDSFEVFVKETLECLRPKERELLMYRIQGFTVDEISEKTGRARRTVERSLQNSRRRLSSLILED